TGRSFDEAYAEIREATGGEFDLVIDASGKGSWEGGNSINLALELLRWGGRFVAYGLPVRDLEVNLRLVTLKGITLKGIDTPPHEVQRLLALGERLVSAVKLRIDELIIICVALVKDEEVL